MEPLELTEEPSEEAPEEAAEEEGEPVPVEEVLMPPQILFEPPTEDKSKLRFAEDIMAPKRTKTTGKAAKAKKKKKGAYAKESTEDGIKARKGRKDFTVEEDEEYY